MCVGGVAMRALRLLAIMAMLVAIVGSSAFAEDKKPKRNRWENQIEKIELRIAAIYLDQTPMSGKDKGDRERAIAILLKERADLVKKNREIKEDPALRKAHRQREKDEKSSQKVADKIRISRNSVDLNGCTPSESYWVNPRIGTEYGLKPSSANSSMAVTIVNPLQYGNVVDITSSLHQELVKSLCSGGTIVITFAARNLGPSNEQIQLTARAQKDGRTVMSTFSFSLQTVYDSRYRQTEARTWRLDLQ